MGNCWVRMEERKGINSLESRIMQMKTDQGPVSGQLGGAAGPCGLKRSQRHLYRVSENQKLGTVITVVLESGSAIII